MNGYVTIARAKVKEVYLICQTVNGIYVPFQRFTFMREFPCQLFHELLTTLRYMISPPVFCKIELIREGTIQVCHMHLIQNAKIVTEPTDIAATLQAANHMHTSVEHLAETCETLQPATHCGVLFHHRNVQPFFRKDGTREQATKPAAYDDCTLIHDFSL